MPQDPVKVEKPHQDKEKLSKRLRDKSKPAMKALALQYNRDYILSQDRSNTIDRFQCTFFKRTSKNTEMHGPAGTFERKHQHVSRQILRFEALKLFIDLDEA